MAALGADTAADVLLSCKNVAQADFQRALGFFITC
jgi:hypothetical protein